MLYYFAYGSNLHHLQMKRRCPNCRFIKKITLNNYKLTFRSKYGAADIEKKIGKKVYGALYIISKDAEKKLDVYEEYPSLYKKKYFILLIFFPSSKYESSILQSSKNTLTKE